MDTVSAPLGLFFGSAGLLSHCCAAELLLSRSPGSCHQSAWAEQRGFTALFKQLCTLLPPDSEVEQPLRKWCFIRKECFLSFASTSMVLLHVWLSD